MQSPLRFLAIGDSLTAGYYSFGLEHHPYAKKLLNLFSSANIPIIIDEKGLDGEHVVSSMIRRLEDLLTRSTYDWVIILGGTNDLGYGKSADQIFNQGLKLMYDMVLQRTNNKSKLVAMTVIENGGYSPDHQRNKQRQNLNQMIKTYVQTFEDQKRICLVDLDQSIPYHSIKDNDQRKIIWDDMVHLKPAGYDQIAHCIFQELYKKIQTEFKQQV